MQDTKQTLQLVPLGVMAARLGIHHAELRHDAETGKLPAVRIGRRGLLFHVATIERLLLERAGQHEVKGASRGGGSSAGPVRLRPKPAHLPGRSSMTSGTCRGRCLGMGQETTDER